MLLGTRCCAARMQRGQQLDVRRRAFVGCRAARAIGLRAPLVLLACCAVATTFGGGHRITQACDTPVYRYAMYSWPPSTYHVFFFHQQEISPTDRETLDRLRARLADPERPANAMLHIVDAGQSVGLDLPEVVRQWWQKAAEGGVSSGCAVLTPRDRLLSEEPLPLDDVEALVDSPARRQVTELLEAGRAGVLVVLSSSDQQASQRAADVVRQVVQRAAAGEIRPAEVPGVEIEDLAAGPQSLEVGVVRLDRHDPAERWFVEQLLGVEADLHEYTAPMVFPVYGRGRAMEPYVGAGVTVENLSQAVAFMSGACSCEIKELNPGMDLLMAWDWEATAARLAELAGDEEGNETYLSASELLPAVVGGGGGFREIDEADVEERSALSESSLVSESAASLPVASAAPGSATAGSPAAEGLSQGESLDEVESQFEDRLLKRLAVVLGLGFVAMVGATFLVFRMRAAG